ncbi:MAG: TIGR03435 family protein [Terracidiphilus sp.]
MNGKIKYSGHVSLRVAAIYLVCAAASALAQENSPPAEAQKAPANLPQFEVASVRPSGPDNRELNGLRTLPGGRIIGKGVRAQYLIMVAFNVQHFQIVGAPVWTDLGTGTGFDIQAVPPADSASAQAKPAFSVDPPDDEECRMLQALLIDRFQLKYHFESREVQTYLLERGKGKLNMQPPKDKTAYPWAGGDYQTWYGGKNISMPKLAVRLSEWLERPVTDQTGLSGSFDFEYKPGDVDNNADITGFLFAAMKALGLDLKASKGSIQTIVIDHIERPSPN